MYRLLSPWLFRMPPERAHDLVVGAARRIGRHPGALRVLRAVAAVEDPRLAVHAFGLRFPNPVGLAAGFDKDGMAPATWSALGFGAVELGTVTTEPQPGQPRPRLFRLPDDRALINRMGFNNAGAEALARRLRALRSRAWFPDAPIGVNVGKSASRSLDEATADYLASLRAVWSVADYLVLNVSSPNTPGLRRLQEAARLQDLLGRAQALQDELGPKPLLLKVSPDLAVEALDEVVGLCERHALSGIVATNTTLERDGLRADPHESGGLSGAPLAERALATLRALRERTRLPLIAVGGIDSPESAIARIDAGATLLQLYTGWIYRGPGLPRAIARGILAELDRRGYADLQTLLDTRDAPRSAGPHA